MKVLSSSLLVISGTVVLVLASFYHRDTDTKIGLFAIGAAVAIIGLIFWVREMNKN